MNAIATFTTVTAIGLLLLSGCGGSDDPSSDAHYEEAMFRGDAQHTGVYDIGSVAQDIGLKWKFKSGEEIRSSPAVVDGVAYIGIYDGHLYAVDIETGQEKWRLETDDSMYSSPAIADGVAYVGSWDGHVYAVDTETGDEKWKFETGDQAVSSPAVVDGTVYFGSVDGNLYAVDIETGREDWKFRIAKGFVFSSPAVAGGVVYYGSHDGNLYAVDAGTGQGRWKFKTGKDLESSPGHRRWGGLFRTLGRVPYTR